MRLLVDTHVFLWAAIEPESLSGIVRLAIEDASNDVYVSSAVSWEIAIKYAKGALSLPLDPVLYVRSRMRALHFDELPITHEHALAVLRLPAIHADPFDRIMIAQAQCEDLTLTTRDARSLAYPVKTLEA